MARRAIDSAKDIDIGRLCEAMQKSRLALRYPREERRKAVQQYIGPHYSEEGPKEDVPVNLLSLYVSIVSRSLIAKNPRIMLSTFNAQIKAAVRSMQWYTNRDIEQKHIAEVFQRIVIDALFSIGIAKVSLADPAEAASVAWSLRAGEPFIKSVDLDDFVYDIHARDLDSLGYSGHRFRVPLDVVMDSKIYGKNRKNLTASPDKFFNEQGDERISVLGRTYYSNQEEFEDHIDLWEVYIPRHRVVVTLADDWVRGAAQSDDGEALRIQPWIGPDCGPYHYLGLGTVPGNARPKAPIQDLMDLHKAVNRAYRKLIRTVDRMKEVTAVRSGAAEDGSRIMSAPDGEMIRVDDPTQIAQLQFGGTQAQAILGIVTVLKDLFSFMGGNLELLGGRSPQSKTASQDQMLNQNASAGIADMQDRTVAFVSKAMNAYLWYEWHDPIRAQKSAYQPGNGDIHIQEQITPAMRAKGRFEDLDIRVDPYSLQHRTPDSRFEALNKVMQGIVLPLIPLLQQSGISVDINAYLKKVSELLDMPDLADVVTIAEPTAPEGAGEAGGAAPPMPAQTERTYNRVSMPGRTERGNNMNMASAMLGVNPGGNPQTSKNGSAKPY